MLVGDTSHITMDLMDVMQRTKNLAATKVRRVHVQMAKNVALPTISLQKTVLTVVLVTIKIAAAMVILL
jgi:hypothetical protein